MGHNTQAKTILWFLTMWSAMGCGLEGMPDVGASEQALIDPQGVNLLGSDVDPLAGILWQVRIDVAAQGPGAQDLRVFRGVLMDTTTGTAAALPITVTPAPDTGTLTIAGVDTTQSYVHPSMTALPGLRLYTVERNGTPLCDDGALLIMGRLDAAGGYDPDPGYFTMACRNQSVAAKCIDWWGYAPWDDSLRFQACTRMGRADYCGEGEPHTFDGTMIQFYDEEVNPDYPTGGLPMAPNTMAPPLAGSPWPFYFEAAWGPQGAICLSRERWSALPLGGPCDNGSLPDPRVTDPESPAGADAFYCDDLDIPSLLAMGAKVLNESHLNDRGLYRWHDAGGNSFTTTWGHCDGMAGANVQPVPGGTYPEATYQGSILSRPDTGTIELRSWLTSQGVRITSTETAPSTASDVRVEGHIFAQQSDALAFIGDMVDHGVSAVRLRRIWTGSRWVTTTEPPPNGATVVTLGWIISQSSKTENQTCEI